MKIIDNNNNSNYSLVDFEDGFKYERIDGHLIKRPDASAHGQLSSVINKEDLSAMYNGEAGEARFQILDPISEDWAYKNDDLTLKLKLTSFKHIGVFPEQIINWDLVKDLIQNSDKDVKVLNLFAYTGAASINAAKAGASEVVHVEALKQLNSWAQENSELSETDDLNIRYFTDDVITFLKREIKRGNKYQIVIMDPPSFGRGPKKQVWKFNENIDELLDLVGQLLEDPLAIIISTYTNHFTKHHLKSLLHRHYADTNVKTYDVKIKSETNKLLAAGITGLVTFDK